MSHKGRKVLLKSLFLVFCLLLCPGIGSAGMEDEISSLRRDMETVKKDLAEIKAILQRALKSRGQGPISTKAEVSVNNGPSLGRENAPVTIVEFSDYQCPFCRRFATTVFPVLKREYIDTGKVRYVFRDFPLSSIHPRALKAAESAHCAGEQNQYWQMHDLLFDMQKTLPDRSLNEFAEDLGMDKGQFTQCLESGRYGPEVQKDLAEGTKAGVRGTPSFVIGKTPTGPTMTGVLVKGAQPFPVFKQLINAVENQPSAADVKPVLIP